MTDQVARSSNQNLNQPSIELPKFNKYKDLAKKQG